MKSQLQIKKILIPLDFSKTSLKALDHAVYLAKLFSSEITLLHASESLVVTTEPGYFIPPSFQEDYEKTMTDQSTKHLNNISDRLQKKGVQVKCLSVIGRTHRMILDTAKSIKADIIVMGTHGVSGAKEFFMGSNTFRVIRDSKCPVLSVQRAIKNPGFKNILIPIRDKPHSREKVDYAIELANKYGATLHVLAVDTEFTKTHKKKMALQANQIQEIAKHKGVPCKTKIIEHAYLSETILKHAQAINADLIVSMSSLDREDITEYFTGPVSQQIVNHSPIPVLSIHPKFNPDTIDLRFY
jgi:nucleotide-binding universal stress UspA family protein